nr:response regulator receiver protein [uncultured Dyadobacter sp.]
MIDSITGIMACMMSKTNILVIANHPEILETIIRLINQQDTWNGIPAGSFEEAEALLRINSVDLVLLGVGVDGETAERILSLCATINPRIVCQRHFGGGSGLLYSEIRHALAGS